MTAELQHRKPELLARIKRLLKAGRSQLDIAHQLDKAPSTIAEHVRNLGHVPKEYSAPAPVKGDRRRCVTCGKMRGLGSFKSNRNATCTMCYRSRKA